MGDWIPGLSGLAPDEQGTEDGVIGRGGVIPDSIQTPLRSSGAAWVSGPLGIVAELDPEERETEDVGEQEIADNLGEALFSPGEQYNPEGWVEDVYVAAFEGGSFNPEGDDVDLPGPTLGEAAEAAEDAATNPDNPVWKLVDWLLNNPVKAGAIGLALYVLPLLTSVLDLVGGVADA